MKKLFVVLVVLVVSQVHLLAQDAVRENELMLVKGTIYEIVNNEKVVLPFANVFIEGTDAITTTDFDGAFELKTAEDVNSLKCTFRGYDAFVKQIDGENTKVIELEILMKREGSAMQNIDIIGKI